MIIPKQDMVKSLLLLQRNELVPEEEDQKSLQKWIQATQVMVDRILVLIPKKKPDSEDKEEEEEEEEEDEEEEEKEEKIATALDSKEVSHVHVLI